MLGHRPKMATAGLHPDVTVVDAAAVRKTMHGR
jgi:hypothetical protein